MDALKASGQAHSHKRVHFWHLKFLFVAIKLWWCLKESTAVSEVHLLLLLRPRSDWGFTSSVVGMKHDRELKT